jgi:hypothetical protein
MRKILVTAIFAVALLGMLSPPVFAQAPTPKVTITGLFDQVTSGGKNFYDGDYTKTNDHEWVSRTRFRPDFVFEVGRTKAVMGLEIDLAYGSFRPAGGGPGKGGTAGASGTSATADRNGMTSDLGLNTDTAGVIEFKWIYTEFDLTGKDSLLPFIPVPTVARAGGQPFASIAQMREYALYAGGDFAGFAAETKWAPNLTTKLAYVLVEDEANGNNLQRLSVGGATRNTRGKDWALIVSPEYTVFKGLDIKPLYSYFEGSGTTSGNTRRSAVSPGLLGGTTADALTWGSGTGGGFTNGNPGLHEFRHTFGFEANYRMGPFGLAPAVYYQHGTRHVLNNLAALTKTEQNAWLIDIVGSYQMGPFLFEVRPNYSTGNKARDNLAKRIQYYEPLDEDSSYYAGWASILALGVDYFNGAQVPNAGMGTNVGYDRYGRAQIGFRATYNLTPALAFYGILSPTWTAEKVDTDTGVASGAGQSGTGQRTIVNANSFVKGDSRYIGTEGDIGVTWKFAPNITFDLAGAWLWAGDALKVADAAGIKHDQHDAWTIASRVRFSF